MNLVTPSGFRDVLTQEARARETITRAVQQLFADRGYLPIETPTLEVLDVMRAGGRLPGSSFKFFDSRGDLLAMRPDVTLQIARMCATRLRSEEGPLRFRYTQRVFRETEADAQAAEREVTQFGVECIGEEGFEADAEIVGLFIDAVRESGVDDFSLALATVGVLRALLDRSGAPEAWKAAVLEAYHASDFVELDRLTDLDGAALEVDVAGVAPAYADAIRALPRIRGGIEAIEAVRSLVVPLGCADGLDEFERTFSALADRGLADRILIDFSVMSSFDYYTGIVFAAYSPHLGSPLGSGGRYDHMIGAYGVERPAAGFAFYLEQVMSAAAAERSAQAALAAPAAGGCEAAIAPGAASRTTAAP
uniref:ATP phosphoribosyltransferase regulatory subunit n=1 Tax=Adlercreutzia sp. ZJ473 TaxID=2722822 RepID=UPI0015523A5B